MDLFFTLSFQNLKVNTAGGERFDLAENKQWIDNRIIPRKMDGNGVTVKIN